MSIYKHPSAKKAKAANPLEKVIEKKVCDHAKELGFLVYKFTSLAKRSVPDRLFITPKGMVFFIEFKRRKEVPTDAQEIEIGKIREKGIDVFVIDNVETGRCLISDIFHGAEMVITVMGVKVASRNLDDY